MLALKNREALSEIVLENMTNGVSMRQACIKAVVVKSSEGRRSQVASIEYSRIKGRSELDFGSRGQSKHLHKNVYIKERYDKRGVKRIFCDI